MFGFLSNSDRNIFLASLVISFVIWILTTLSQVYTTEIMVPVAYKNLPTDKVLINTLERELYMDVEARGIDLILQIGVSPKTIVVDYEKYVKSPKIGTRSLISPFERQLSTIAIKAIQPDTIYFRFDKRSEKLVPIVLQADVLAETHFRVNKIAITPDSVFVTGPASIVDSLKAWHTEKLTLRGITQSFDNDIELLKPQYETINLSIDYTNYFIDVEEFTEKELNVPIEIKNIPKNLNVFPYPKTVRILFQVGVGDYDEIVADDFMVVADFSKINIMNNTKIPLTLVDKPPRIKNEYFSPKSCDYIIME